MAMIFKLLEAAEGRWRSLNGYRLVPLVREKLDGRRQPANGLAVAPGDLDRDALALQGQVVSGSVDLLFRYQTTNTTYVQQNPASVGATPGEVDAA